MKDKKYGEKVINIYADPKNWEIWDAPKGREVIYQTFSEFTCLCPRSSYPDFATVHLIIIPSKKVLELKVLKLWLNSFRTVKISHENATEYIVDILVKKLKLNYCFALMQYTPRGNLTTYPMKEYIGKRQIPELKTAQFIKERLLSKLI